MTAVIAGMIVWQGLIGSLKTVRVMVTIDINEVCIAGTRHSSEECRADQQPCQNPFHGETLSRCYRAVLALYRF